MAGLYPERTPMLRLGLPDPPVFSALQVDLVVRQGDRLRAFEIKWSGRPAPGRAFRDAYGVTVETIGPQEPFAAELP
jgi:hypothetical protein